MVDITITPGSVIPGSDASIEHGIAGATITAGKVVFLNATSGKYGLADNNATTPPETKVPRGVALNGASDGQPCAIVRAGDCTIGGLVAGTDYYLSDTPGGICPRADLLTGETVTMIGLAISVAVLRVNIQATGVTI